jgi:hypothetical protein
MMGDLEYVSVRKDEIDEVRDLMERVLDALETYEHLVFWCDDDPSKTWDSAVKLVAQELRARISAGNKLKNT